MLTDRAGLAEDERKRLEAELARFGLLEQVVRWGFAKTPPRPVVDIVVQDEFTHDVVLAYRDSLHLVFSTT